MEGLKNLPRPQPEECATRQPREITRSLNGRGGAKVEDCVAKSKRTRREREGRGRGEFCGVTGEFLELGC
jgi:hypothetical protein